MSPANPITAVISVRIPESTARDLARRLEARAYRTTRARANVAFDAGDIAKAKRLDAQADRIAAGWAASCRIDD